LRLLLDTNVILWVLSDDKRIAPIRNLLLDDGNEVFVSTASWWEIAIKVGIGKLDAKLVELRQASMQSGFDELPILGVHTEMLAQLPLLHKDPFDRLIVAQAMTEPMQLITGDVLLKQYSDLVRLI
jgi:PIN domain nuclease of toxin-antitoxin system